MRRKLQLFLLLTLAAAISACSNGAKPEPAKTASGEASDGIVVSIKGEPAKGFDPAFDWPGLGEALFQSKLVVFDKEMYLVNDLAVERAVSEDGKELTVKLRDDVLYSDGVKFTASDVVFTFGKVRETTSYIDLSNVKEVVAVDDHTVKFVLEHPDSTFEYTLTRIAIIPEHAYGPDYAQHPIGSGPYKFVEWQKGQKLVVEANPLYYGKKPNIGKVTFLYLDMDASFAGAKRGEIDIARVSMDYIGKEIPGYTQRSIETMDIVSLSLPTVRTGTYEMDGMPIGNDVTADRAIRRALSYGMDREGISRDALSGGTRPVYSHNPGMPWDNEANVIPNADIDTAKRILEEGGWSDSDGDGIVEKDGIMAEFTLLYTPGEVERQAVVLGVQESARKIGIQVNLEAKVWDEISKQKLIYKEAYLFGKGADSPFEIYTNFSSDRIAKGTTNSPSYKNEIVDDYLNKAIQTTDQDEAMAYWQKAQWDGEHGANALGDSPFVPIVAFHHTFYIKDGVEIGDFRPAPHRGAYWITVENIKDWVKR
ncbi:ABC transporter substrate-binding protein [Paenibacillus arenilitoris]|uniref:ABC transporter substrate-binding protein n=1 Tax=Paenibacillus arenilitoris TaxID=2772299 RepID=A0A927CGY1_9BACL|nr:ABC transporter substrate-binding protein [Paenibacillus arenilitoris]MBD2867294.1 ABC transporter substrate-binding protein [Paenibacillus arenilitoris]